MQCSKCKPERIIHNEVKFPCTACCLDQAFTGNTQNCTCAEEKVPLTGIYHGDKTTTFGNLQPIYLPMMNGNNEFYSEHQNQSRVKKTSNNNNNNGLSSGKLVKKSSCNHGYHHGCHSSTDGQLVNGSYMKLSQHDKEVLDELEESFPSLAHGWISVCELRNSLEVAGFNLPGHEYRDLERELPNYANGKIPYVNFLGIYMRVKEAKDTSKVFRKENILKERSSLRVYESEDMPNSTAPAKHSVSPAEERAFVDWINRMLCQDVDLCNYLPIQSSVDGQLYDRCRDGLLLCKLINFAVPNTIDERCINKPPFTKSVFKSNENLMLAVNSAESIGCCVVNVGPEDIANCSRHLVLGLIWQIIRIGLLSVISLSHHAELAALCYPHETLDDLRLLSPEDLLIRWVDYHLEFAGITHRMTNFMTDLMDSEIYAALLQQVAPDDKKLMLIPASSILAESDMYRRAEMVIENAEFLGAGAFLSAEDICAANEKGMNRDKLHLAFLANLFNLYPGFESGPIFEVEETLEEKTYRNWMNSMGVVPFVKDLSADLRTGLIFLQLIDVLRPGIVNWSKIVRLFDHKRRLFQMQDNCSYVIDYASQLYINVVNQSGEDIRTGERKLTLGLTFQLMRLHTIQMLSKLRGSGWNIDDKDILAWANEKLASVGAPPLMSFRDCSITTGVPVLNIINAIKPNSVDKGMVSKDKDANCRLAISTARKVGARVYALPEHLREANLKMVMTVFACMMALDIQLNQKPTMLC